MKGGKTISNPISVDKEKKSQIILTKSGEIQKLYFSHNVEQN